MFGSVFRSILVIGTIYALSPVKLDGSAVPSAQASTSKQANATHKQAAASDSSNFQSAAIAMVTGINPLASGQSVENKGSQSKDQIGDLIALGKDVCLANPGLCAEVARSAASSVTRKTASPQQAASAAPPSNQAQSAPPRQSAVQNSESAKITNKPVSQNSPAKVTPANQPDLLGVLIEKVAPPATKPSSEKMVAKAQRSN